MNIAEQIRGARDFSRVAWATGLDARTAAKEVSEEAVQIAEAGEAKLREALKGYPDSDLVSLAETLRTRADLCDAKDEEIKALCAKLVLAREMAEFYAKHGEGCRKITPEGEVSRKALDRDGGKMARAFLKETA